VAASYAVSSGDTKLVELRVVEGTLYARVSLDDIARVSGKQADIDKLKARASAAPPSMPFVQNALKGDWIGIELAPVTTLLKQFSSRFSGGTMPPAAGSNDDIRKKLQDALVSSSTVTRVGAEDEGDHLKVTTKTRALFENLTTVLKSLSPALSGRLAGRSDPSNVPDRELTFDAYVKDGALSELDFDIVQALPDKDKAQAAGKKLVFRIQFDTAVSDVSKPDNVTMVDISKIIGGLMGRTTPPVPIVGPNGTLAPTETLPPVQLATPSPTS
jgi:hypothetical protein